MHMRQWGQGDLESGWERPQKFSHQCLEASSLAEVATCFLFGCAPLFLLVRVNQVCA